MPVQQAPVKKSGSSDAWWTRYIIMLITVFNLLAITVGGFLFIARYESELSDQSRQLADMQAAQRRQEQQTAIETLQLATSIDTLKTLNSLKPAVFVQIENKLGKEQSIVEVFYRLKNGGQYDANAKITQFVLFDQPPNSGGNPVAIELLKAEQPLTMPPGAEQLHSVQFKLKNYAKKTAYYSITYEFETNPLIIAVASQLFNKLGIDAADSMGKITTTAIGTINF